MSVLCPSVFTLHHWCKSLWPQTLIFRLLFFLFESKKLVHHMLMLFKSKEWYVTLIGEEFCFMSADELEAVSAVEKFSKMKLETDESQ